MGSSKVQFRDHAPNHFCDLTLLCDHAKKKTFVTSIVSGAERQKVPGHVKSALCATRAAMLASTFFPHHIPQPFGNAYLLHKVVFWFVVWLVVLFTSRNGLPCAQARRYLMCVS